MKRVNYIYMFSLILATLLSPISMMAQSSLVGSDSSEQKIEFKQKAESEQPRDIGQSTLIKKGEIILGITASYGTMSSENSKLFYLLSGIDASLGYGSIDPFMGYFYRDNRCLGLRMGYSTMNGKIDSGAIDFGETNDLEFDIPYVNLSSSSFNYSVFHRSYLSMDKKGNFGLFAEFELMASDGRSTLSYDMGGSSVENIHNNSFSLNLNFNPGIVVFVLENVSTNVSFGMGGLGYHNVKQLDADGASAGSRSTSQMRFKFNITDINFGITVHL